MGLSFPFFFLMKKNDAAYGLFDGCIVPRAVCSFKNLDSSPCSVWERQMVLLMSVAGAPGFRSMLWSQDREGGSPFPHRCSKMLQ